jgi:hypothetical protein
MKSTCPPPVAFCSADWVLPTAYCLPLRSAVYDMMSPSNREGKR